MSSSFRKTVREAQPAIALATALAFVCADHKWQAAGVVFALLQVAVLAAARWARPAHHASELRFVGRGAVTTVEARRPPALNRRPRLHLVR